jgi:hypothetical protein
MYFNSHNVKIFLFLKQTNSFTKFWKVIFVKFSKNSNFNFKAQKKARHNFSTPIVQNVKKNLKKWQK